MEVKYKIYERVEDESLHISTGELPTVISRQKQKYLGKRARIEAIRRFTGEELPDHLSAKEVKEHVSAIFFGTSYHSIYKEVCAEMVNITEHYRLIQEVNVVLKDDMCIEPDDHRLLYMLSYELSGEHLYSHKGLKNPIISHDYNREK